MKIRFIIVLALALVQIHSARVLSQVPPSISAFTKDHCVHCHSGDEPAAGLNLETLGFELANEETARRWVLVHDRIAAGEMPPADEERPNAKLLFAFLKSVSENIVSAETQRKDVVLRRLNRYEYQNTVRDLFRTDVIVHGLPEDSSTDGFDTVGEGLAVSAEAMTTYLEAADQVLDAVFGPGKKPKSIRHETNLLKQVDWKGNAVDQQFGKMFRVTDEGLVIFQSGYCPTNLVNFARLRPPAGTYRGTLKVRAVQTNRPVILRIYGGDTIVNRREQHLVGYYDVPPDEWTTIEFTDRFVESGGTFLPKCYGTRDARKNANTYPEPGIEISDIVIEGPIEPWPPLSRKRLLTDVDLKSAAVDDAKEILDRILPRAFRRPVEASEVDSYLKLFVAATVKGRSFESALRVSLKAILCSPDFLFLSEPGIEQIDQHALASRLSYFLWSSMPDEELRSFAENGSLNRPDILRAEVERMLKSARAAAFTKNFTGQWLDLREINFTEPDSNLYPEFDELLRISMVKETQLFFREILDNDLSLMNFVDSDFTFLNGRLAKHYGIEGIEGQKFRRVPLPSTSQRGGLLTQASILKVTANGTYTSPVLRGTWILEKILGQPTSPPPDNVGSVEPDIRGATTIREQLAKHRNIESCAACHQKIDPPGFALECFDPIGGFRNEYRTMAQDGRRSGLRQAPFTYAWVKYRIGQPVDATAQMPDGTPIKTVRDFRSILAANPDQLARNLGGKLMTYALGRRMGFSDRAEIEMIVRNNRQQQYGFRSLVHAIVQSPAFQQP